MASPAKLSHLESVRGLAAAAVVVSHVLSAFASPGPDGVPTVVGGDGPAVRAVARLLMTPIGDGRFAVAVFFVLSGVVLSQRPLQTGERPALGPACARRFVRLAWPAAVATFIGWAAWQFGATGIRPAADLLAADGVSARWLLLLDPPDRSLSAAVAEAGWGLYVTVPPPPQHELFNCALWTIPIELYGSVAVYLSLIVIRWPWPVARLAALAGVAGVTAALAGGVFAAMFLAGVWLAACRHRSPAAGLSPVAGLSLVAVAFWLAGRVEADYGWWSALAWPMNRLDPHNLFSGAAAVLLVGAGHVLSAAGRGPVGPAAGVARRRVVRAVPDPSADAADPWLRLVRPPPAGRGARVGRTGHGGGGDDGVAGRRLGVDRAGRPPCGGGRPSAGRLARGATAPAAGWFSRRTHRSCEPSVRCEPTLPVNDLRRIHPIATA